MDNTPKEFDKELRRIIHTAIITAKGDAVHSPDEALAEEVALEKSKQAVDKYVIGTGYYDTAKEDEEYANSDLSWNADIDQMTSQSTAIQRMQQRQSLWGNK